MVKNPFNSHFCNKMQIQGTFHSSHKKKCESSKMELRQVHEVELKLNQFAQTKKRIVNKTKVMGKPHLQNTS